MSIKFISAMLAYIPFINGDNSFIYTDHPRLENCGNIQSQLDAGQATRKQQLTNASRDEILCN